MIRHATHKDIPQIRELGRQMLAESNWCRFPFNDERVDQFLAWLIDGEEGIAIVSEEDGVIQGGFLGGIIKHYFGHSKQAYDYALFLSPEHRGGRLAAKIIKAYVLEATMRGADQILIATSTGYQPERTAQLYEATGFNRIGYVYEFAND